MGELVAAVLVLLPLAYVAVALYVALVVVPRNRRPGSATAWIITILFVPALGLLAFAVIGNPRLPLARRLKQRDIDRVIHERVASAELGRDQAPGPPWLDPLVRLNQELGAVPMLAGNSLTIETGYEASILGMARDIGTARHYVHVEFFIFALDDTTRPFFEAMAAAVRRGVTVRVLLDHIGAWTSVGYRQTLAFMDDAGIDYRLMLPVQPWKGRYQRPDLRNHRKLVVVDGTVAWAGSLNLVDSSYNKRKNLRRGRRWRELMVRVRGHAVVAVDGIFATDWFCETDVLLDVGLPEQLAGTHGEDWVQVVPSGPGFDHEINLRMFNEILHGARSRLSITSPYFVPDDSLLYAITSASLRGVAVELFVSYESDQFLVHHAQRSYYEFLLRAGVRIYRYPSPAVLHSKHLSVDDDVAVVGSSNLDIRSFTLNLESSLLIQSRSFVDRLRLVEDEYRSLSRELVLEDWLQRPRRERVVDNLARLDVGAHVTGLPGRAGQVPFEPVEDEVEAEPELVAVRPAAADDLLGDHLDEVRVGVGGQGVTDPGDEVLGALARVERQRGLGEDEAVDVGVDGRERVRGELDGEAAAAQAREDGLVVAQQRRAGGAAGLDEPERPRVRGQGPSGRLGARDHRRAPRVVRAGQVDVAEHPVREAVDERLLAGDVVVQRHRLDPELRADRPHAHARDPTRGRRPARRRRRRGPR